MYKACIAICLFLIGPWNLEAQTDGSISIPQTVRKGIIYKRERSFNMALHTNGFYIGMDKGRIKKYYLSHFNHIDFGLLEHPKESKIYANFALNSHPLSSYTYAKQNSFWNIRLGRGLIRYYSEKTRHKGIAMGIYLEGGVNIGLLKPYYIKVEQEKDGRRIESEIRYSSELKELFLDQNSINGASRFFKGISETSIRPGAHGRIGLQFDPGAFEKYVRAINAGFILDIYPGRIPIMVLDQNPFYFLNVYVNLQLGKRK